MRCIKIAGRAVPLGLIAVLLISGIGLSLLAYVSSSVTIPFEVKEPLEILSYPSGFSLFPGETVEFNVTVKNHASINYSVMFEYRLNNSGYQTNCVRFSDETFNVGSGVQTLTTWLFVEPNAPPIQASLTINLLRVRAPECVEFEEDFESYQVGEFPYRGDWELWYFGAGKDQQIVVDFASVSPTRSLQLLGWGIEEGSHLSAVVAYPLAEEHGASMFYSAYVMVDEVCSFDSSAVVGFGKATSVGSSRCNEVRFHSDGMMKTMVAGNQLVSLQSYEPDTWYKIEVLLDTTTDTFSVWIDGELVGSDFNTKFPSSEIEAFLLLSRYGNVKAYFDDIAIYQEG